jgi:hypothetical protein
MKKKIIWGIVIVGLVAGSIAAYFAYNAFTEKSPTAEDLATDMKVDAETVMQEFIKDTDAASKKYNETVIEISGTIVEMQTEDENDLSVSLETTATDDMGIGRSVRVTMIPKMADVLKKYKSGDKITAKGIFNGFDVDLVFNMGVIVE